MRLQVLPHMKVCTVCGEAKAADQFYAKYRKCKACRRLRERA